MPQGLIDKFCYFFCTDKVFKIKTITFLLLLLVGFSKFTPVFSFLCSSDAEEEVFLCMSSG